MLSTMCSMKSCLVNRGGGEDMLGTMSKGKC